MVQQAEGLTRIESRHSVDETVRRVQDLLTSKGVQIFAVIDHSGEASKVGLTMPSTRVIIFGSPKVGTPLMLAAPSTAIDLPLKALIAEDEAGKVSITWNNPQYLQARHDFPVELIKNIEPVSALLRRAAE